MQNLHLLVNQLESNISQFETTNNSVSGGSVGWHIEHSLKTIDQIITACKNSNPVNYQWQFNFKRFLIKLLKKSQEERQELQKLFDLKAKSIKKL